MEEAPNSFNKKMLLRTTIAGTVLALVGVAIFGGMWLFLGQIGLDDFPRLLASFCIPPAAITGIIGAYLLLIQPKEDNTSESESE